MWIFILSQLLYTRPLLVDIETLFLASICFENEEVPYIFLKKTNLDSSVPALLCPDVIFDINFEYS